MYHHRLIFFPLSADSACDIVSTNCKQDVFKLSAVNTNTFVGSEFSRHEESLTFLGLSFRFRAC